MMLLSKIIIFIYSFILKFKLHNLGVNSQIHYLAKIINHQKIFIGDNTTICEQVWLNCGGSENKIPSLIIHGNSYIGRMSQINAWKEVIIESDVLIADRVFISDADHNYKNQSVPIIKQNDKFKGKVLIKSGAWIGINAVILPGVTIGKNAIVCPNSVVIKDVLDYEIVSGVPAKTIKNYDKKNF